MICIGIYFVYTVFTCFALYRLINNFKLDDIYFVARNCYWNIFFSVQIIFVIIFSNRITSEGCKTGFLVHQLLNLRDIRDADEEMLINLSMQILQMSPVLTCHAFTVDWTLVYSVKEVFQTYFCIYDHFYFQLTASLGTYLTILMQFEES